MHAILNACASSIQHSSAACAVILGWQFLHPICSTVPWSSHASWDASSRPPFLNSPLFKSRSKKVGISHGFPCWSTFKERSVGLFWSYLGWITFSAVAPLRSLNGAIAMRASWWGKEDHRCPRLCRNHIRTRLHIKVDWSAFLDWFTSKQLLTSLINLQKTAFQSNLRWSLQERLLHTM